MAESIGSLKPSNGSSPANGKMNGQAAARRRPDRRRSRIMTKVLSITARLATWAVILTILFRCPSSLEACDESSPIICEHYFRAKSVVSPYVGPIYDQNVAPYIEYVRPYYEAADAHLLTPTRAYAVRYGSPLVNKAQEQVSQQWGRYGQPQVAQFRGQLADRYARFVAPHLTRVTEAVEPYCEIGRAKSQQLFYEFLIPLYEFAQPYARRGYATTSAFATETIVPAVHWTWDKTNAFLCKAIWPQVRMLYVENVEPQLVRIGERLERYKNKTGTAPKTKSQSEASLRSSGSTSAWKKPTEPQSSFSKPAPRSTAASAPGVEESRASASSAKGERRPEAYWNPIAGPVVGDNETEQRKKAREMVAEDLDMWQNKFAAQADEGALAIEEHIDGIARSMVAEEVVVTGMELLKKLNLTVKSEVDGLKGKIVSIIEGLSSLDDGDEAGEHVVGAIRAAGVAVKQAAQAVRDWRDTYDSKLQAMVLEAADVHFQILDETRSLALQQIGMKWAWADGVTYRDWAKYHELKKTLSGWTEELKKLIVSHPALLEAQEASAQVEDEGMMIASAAAKELARLKQVARWKVLARDVSDDFGLAAMKSAAEAKEAGKGAPKEAMDGAAAETLPRETQASVDDDDGQGEDDGSDAGKPQATQASGVEFADEATPVDDGMVDGSFAATGPKTGDIGADTISSTEESQSLLSHLRGVSEGQTLSGPAGPLTGEAGQESPALTDDAKYEDDDAGHEKQEDEFVTSASDDFLTGTSKLKTAFTDAAA